MTNIIQQKKEEARTLLQSYARQYYLHSEEIDSEDTLREKEAEMEALIDSTAHAVREEILVKNYGQCHHKGAFPKHGLACLLCSFAEKLQYALDADGTNVTNQGITTRTALLENLLKEMQSLKAHLTDTGV